MVRIVIGLDDPSVALDLIRDNREAPLAPAKTGEHEAAELANGLLKPTKEIAKILTLLKIKQENRLC
ncbi:MAG: hypothetical protein JW941_07165 [Candidatus Coatesbacteria bacterium]|nr:hypothetical protein [Candidatus Coatesbacteria bacterium]